MDISTTNLEIVKATLPMMTNHELQEEIEQLDRAISNLKAQSPEHHKLSYYQDRRAVVQQALNTRNQGKP